MFRQLFFSKAHPYCKQYGIKAGSDSKKTDKHAADCSKAVYWGRKVIYVRCIKCSCNNVAKGIRLLDKKTTTFFCLYRKNFMQVTAFEDLYPLKIKKLVKNYIF